MMRYTFQPYGPQHTLVIDAAGNQVGYMYNDAAIVTVAMYENLFRQNERRANEFMYGYMLGVTHALLYQEHMPKCRIERDAGGVRAVMTDVVTGKEHVVSPNDPSGAPHAAAILNRAFGKKDN